MVVPFVSGHRMNGDEASWHEGSVTNESSPSPLASVDIRISTKAGDFSSVSGGLIRAGGDRCWKHHAPPNCSRSALTRNQPQENEPKRQPLVSASSVAEGIRQNSAVFSLTITGSMTAR